MPDKHVCKVCGKATEHFFAVDDNTICCGCHRPDEVCKRCDAKKKRKED